MDSWAEGPLCGFDTETTGRDPMAARIVTASFVRCETGRDFQPVVTEWLVAVDEPIPVEATAIHSITTEFAQDNGLPLSKVVTEIKDQLLYAWSSGIPVTIQNALYDLTVLNHELVRCGLEPLVFTAGTAPILDPLVIDRAVDRYRRGKRTLTASCAHYGIPLTQAHTSSADAVAAVGVMRQIADQFPDVARVSLADLYRRQEVWHANWAANFQNYLRSCRAAEGASSEEIEAVVVDRSWPVRAGEPS